MVWYSILPPQLIYLESWAARIFFVLGVITIVPWAALLIFDAVLYLYRMVLWELPWIGGRARGEQRPRAPSLNERPGGQRRAFGLRGVETDAIEGGADTVGEESADGPRERDWDGSKDKENVAPFSAGWNPPLSGEAHLKSRVSGRI